MGYRPRARTSTLQGAWRSGSALVAARRSAALNRPRSGLRATEDVPLHSTGLSRDDVEAFR
jgi:hypothetical protein